MDRLPNSVLEQCLVVKEIIEAKSVETYFQPLVSLKNGKVIGVEALSRGRHLQQTVMPDVLFAQAQVLGKRLQLDRLCRDKAFQAFQACHDFEWLLFVNIDASILTEGVVGSDYLLESVRTRGLDPTQVVIEISEGHNQSHGMLERFIDQYRRHGFMIALDDVGVGDSNLARILIAKPDVIKLDRCMVQNLMEDAYKREMFLALVTLAKRVGALTVAEGVETEAEAMAACELGADFAQGYYYSRPVPASDCGAFETLNESLKLDIAKYQDYKIAKIAAAYQRLDRQEVFVKRLAEKMTHCLPEEFDAMLRGRFREESLECLYILDSCGRQISDSICEDHAYDAKRLFKPAPKGSDQSAKPYCMHILAGRKFYVSEPYVSFATGRLNRTISCLVFAADGNGYILCVDFSFNE